jgi:hypothetical protein
MMGVRDSEKNCVGLDKLTCIQLLTTLSGYATSKLVWGCFKGKVKTRIIASNIKHPQTSLEVAYPERVVKS